MEHTRNTRTNRQPSRIIQRTRITHPMRLFAVKSTIHTNLPLIQHERISPFNLIIFILKITTDRVGRNIRKIKFRITHRTPSHMLMFATRIADLTKERTILTQGIFAQSTNTEVIESISLIMKEIAIQLTKRPLRIHRRMILSLPVRRINKRRPLIESRISIQLPQASHIHILCM